MSLTVNAKSYTNDVAQSRDSYRYLGPSHDFTTEDRIDFWRKAPIVTVSSNGKGRAIVKLTRTVTDGTDPVGEAILKIESSFPADGATAELQALLNDLGAWLDGTESTEIFLNHNLNQ